MKNINLIRNSSLAQIYGNCEGASVKGIAYIKRINNLNCWQYDFKIIYKKRQVRIANYNNGTIRTLDQLQNKIKESVLENWEA